MTYAEFQFRNSVLQFKKQESALTDEQFIEQFGPPPWELLNEILQIIGLPYKFDQPEPGVDGVEFAVALTGPHGVSIPVDQLSTGERVLMAIATARYIGSKFSDEVQVPKVLLLDEADASLHPSMVKSLLTVIQDLFIKQYGMRVILTTHAPSTVALAPEESLYILRDTSPRIQKTTADHAIKSLTTGISTLSVRVDNRRQVFVESEYDQEYLQHLFGITKDYLRSETSLEFIAVGRRDKGGGCEAVVRLVKELRTAGVDTVSGVVDRDVRSTTPEGIFYLADRYSIENLIFDPVLLGTFLLRERILQASDLQIGSGLRHFELTSTHAQQIATSLSSRLKFAGTDTSVEYTGKFSIVMPDDWLETQGHQLQAIIVQEFRS
ncbi:ATP-dependent nuclease [Kribbella sp. CA-294648]|uniref:ATP-dependent nuclease n=1 Tax=Kribbella sp. CA-294648 TaxID=3239948 RepID=UPI003D929EFC